MDAPAEEGLALTMTTPRRRRSERRDTHQQTPMAAAAPPEAPNVAAAARNHHGDDGPRLADAAQALTFVKRVHETAGPVVHARFLAVLSEAKGSEDMAADQIYDRAKQAFGPAHVGLLHAFATVWLPGAEEWKLQQQARGPAARQRSRAAAASASEAGMPDAKKPRADDDGNARRHDPAAIVPRQQRNRAAAASSHAAATGMPVAKKPRCDDGNNGRQHDHVIAVLEVRNVKKRRSDDDGTARALHALHRIDESSGGGAAAQARDDVYDYAPQSRAKKHHSGNGEFSGSAAEARVLGADATGVHHAYSDNDKKPPRRRAANEGKSSSAAAAAAAGPKQQPERDDEVRRFRQEWEFQTYYSKLVATSDRVTELLRPTRTRTPHGDGGGGSRSLEALFPLPECREFLHNYYGDLWGEMRAALERGESRVPALEAIERRLTTKEEEAVAEESRKRCRHDPARVAQRLHGLAMDYTLDEEYRRHHGGGA
jgi:hypothetical protein